VPLEEYGTILPDLSVDMEIIKRTSTAAVAFEVPDTYDIGITNSGQYFRPSPFI